MSADPVPERGASAPRDMTTRGTDVPRSGTGFRVVWILLVVGAGVGIWFAFLRGGGSDHARLQGEWNYSAAGRNNLGVIRVEGDVWTYRSGGPHGKSYRLTLRPEATPKEIDLALLGDDGRPATFTHGAGRGNEVKLQGIYEINGDTVKLALGVSERPKTFDDDEAQQLILSRN
jgi:uncharacterized protein (TIGR03067 family)